MKIAHEEQLLVNRLWKEKDYVLAIARAFFGFAIGVSGAISKAEMQFICHSLNYILTGLSGEGGGGLIEEGTEDGV